MTRPTTPFPDEKIRKVWKHRGIWCMVAEGYLGFCGYVHVPKTHPWYAFARYDEIPVDVHGGLTFGWRPAGPLDGGWTHDDVHGWVGFDTGHYSDLAIDFAMVAESHGSKGMVSHWTLEEVVAETERLAEQAAAAAKLADAVMEVDVEQDG